LLGADSTIGTSLLQCIISDVTVVMCLCVCSMSSRLGPVNSRPSGPRGQRFNRPRSFGWVILHSVSKNDTGV